MTRHGTRHWDVAAYALGVLDPAEVPECEAHLAECESCAAELDALLPTSRLLADVDLDALRQAEESPLGDRLLAAVRVERNRAQRRRRVLAATGTAMAAAVAGVALLVGATWLATDPSTSGQVAAPGSPARWHPRYRRARPGRRRADLGRRLGDRSDRRRDPGQHRLGYPDLVALSSVTGPRDCQLLVVRADGST